MVKSIKDFFPIDAIETTFYKRQTTQRGVEEIKINAGFDGLHHYFTARNIRYKIRHPLFLALKFSDCIKLYYNTEIITNNDVPSVTHH